MTENKVIDPTRLDHVIEKFKRIFDVDPVAVIRAPGRVNLIGEHTDYNGYPVLPMAIERDILIILRPRQKPQIRFDNTLSNYGARTFFLDQPIQPFHRGDWGNYIKAGILGVLDLQKTWQGFDAMIDGSIPPASGLSSSSALVVAAALALLHCNKVDLDPIDLAQRLAESEKFVGTAGGGMDQTISLNGLANHAVKISFYPLAIQPVRMPDSLAIVICNSMIKAPKTEHAMIEYNRRPLECQIATRILADHFARFLNRPVKATRLADLDPQRMQISLKEHSRICKEVLQPEIMSLDQIRTKSGVSKKELFNEFSLLRSCADILSQKGFPLAARVRHVYSEALRVESAVQALLDNDSRLFGQLMNESHASCRDDYEISTPEMDTLVQIARDAGALGARLTGAGFGGCTVNLVVTEHLQAFTDRIWQEYYLDYLAKNRSDIDLKSVNLKDVIITSKPAKGATAFTFSEPKQ